MCLSGIGCRTTQVATADAALAALRRQHFDLAFLDVRLETTSGIDLLPSLLAAATDLDIVMITAYATVETAVEAIRRGARDYLPKPFTPAQIRQLTERISERRNLEREVHDLRARLDEVAPGVEFETQSPRMHALLGIVDKAAQHDVPVLISGENGTGKNV